MSVKPKNTTLVQFYSEVIKAFLQYLGKSRDLKHDHIHKLRVNIKHLRAILELLQNLTENIIRRKELSSRLSQIFRPTGEFRNAYIQQKLMDQYDPATTTSFKKHLAELEVATRKAVIEALEAFDVDEFIQKSNKIKLYIKKVKKKDLKKGSEHLIRKLTGKIQTLISKKNLNRDLHDIRKLLKVVKSILEVLLAVNYKPDFGKKFKLIKKSESLIGDWHDREVLLESVLDFIAKNEKDSKINQLKKVARKIQTEKEGLAMKIREML